MAKKKKSKNKKDFNQYLIIIFTIIAIVTFLFLFKLNIIPIKYIVVAIIAFGLIDLLLYKWLNQKGIKKVVAILLTITLSIGMILGIGYEISTSNFFSKISNNEFKTITYQIVVLKDSEYKKIEELKDKYIGIKNTTEKDYNQAINFLEDKISIKKEKVEDSSHLADKLLTSEVSAILVEDSINKILKEENEDYDEKTKSLYSFSIELKQKDISKKVDVTKDSFNIFISGIDTYGQVNSNSRSDVNMVVTVNPKTREIRMTSIPRDYYVSLPDKAKYKDKLTHAGIYGVEQSVGAVENLLDIDINYYFKFNFTSLIDIVNTIGGITVDSEYEFTTIKYKATNEQYTFYKGKNNLNGKEALAFARERKAFIGGDRIRNENQQLVVKAILKKALSTSIIIKYNDLLNTLSNSFITNMTDEEIKSLIKQELDLREEWTITSYVLEGTDSYDYTYSYQSGKLYVMNPDNLSVLKAQEEIRKILND